MIPFNELSPAIRGTFGTCVVLLSVAAVYILVTVCILKLERRYLLLSIALMGTVVCVAGGWNYRKLSMDITVTDTFDSGCLCRNVYEPYTPQEK